eukprot:762433-Hanusia_phi.AAC.15
MQDRDGRRWHPSRYHTCWQGTGYRSHHQGRRSPCRTHSWSRRKMRPGCQAGVVAQEGLIGVGGARVALDAVSPVVSGEALARGEERGGGRARRVCRASLARHLPVIVVIPRGACRAVSDGVALVPGYAVALLAVQDAGEAGGRRRAVDACPVALVRFVLADLAGLAEAATAAVTWHALARGRTRRGFIRIFMGLARAAGCRPHFGLVRVGRAGNAGPLMVGVALAALARLGAKGADARRGHVGWTGCADIPVEVHVVALWAWHARPRCWLEQVSLDAEAGGIACGTDRIAHGIGWTCRAGLVSGLVLVGIDLTDEAVAGVRKVVARVACAVAGQGAGHG